MWACFFLSVDSLLVTLWIFRAQLHRRVIVICPPQTTQSRSGLLWTRRQFLLFSFDHFCKRCCNWTTKINLQHVRWQPLAITESRYSEKKKQMRSSLVLGKVSDEIPLAQMQLHILTLTVWQKNSTNVTIAAWSARHRKKCIWISVFMKKAKSTKSWTGQRWNSISYSNFARTNISVWKLRQT